ncbi:putative acetyltransferase [Mycobacterium sp. MAA66]|uniref:acetyltransferase n=1 Tax=Mycobacterium sp. MAA66 TaxID=3156297 RepID=UPI003510D444
MSVAQLRDCVGEAEYPRLVAIWRSAVDATHHFLTDGDRSEIEGQLAQVYFPQVRLTVAEIGGQPVGFAGTAGESLEMLFVDAPTRGHGVGSLLLEHVVRVCGIRAVDVNEQNDQAVGFYLRHDFVVCSRSDVDEAGRPYPLLHLKRD